MACISDLGLLITPTTKRLGRALRRTPLCKRDQSFCPHLEARLHTKQFCYNEAGPRSTWHLFFWSKLSCWRAFVKTYARVLMCSPLQGCNLAGHDSNLYKYLWPHNIDIYCIDGVFRRDLELELKLALRNKSRTMNVTALPTCPLDFDNSTYSCANPYPNCTNAASFQFASLWIITQAIATCPNDTRLFNSQPMLTTHANRPCLPTLHTKEGMDASSRRRHLGSIDNVEVPLAAIGCCLSSASVDVRDRVLRVASSVGRSYIHNRESALEGSELPSEGGVVEV